MSPDLPYPPPRDEEPAYRQVPPGSPRRPPPGTGGQLGGTAQGPPPPPSSRKTGLVVLLAVLAVVALAAGAFFLVRGDGERSREATIRAFQEASETNDCVAAVDLMTAESWAVVIAEADGTRQVRGSPSRAEAIQSCREHSEDNIDETLDKVEVISEEDDRAVVAVTATSEGETSTHEFVLTREGGTWKLDLAASVEATRDT
jgi:ketosteroid isomerase-like protein